MSDRFRVPASLAQRLRGHGVALSTVLRRAGLAPDLFQRPRAFVSTAELFAFWRAVEEESGDPAIGLKLGGEQRLEHYNPTAIAAVCSRTFRDALQRMARFKRLTCPEEIRLQEAGDEAWVEFAFTQADQLEPDVLVDLCLSWILAIGRRGTDGRITPLRVELMRAARHAELLEGHFGCRVRFLARRNALIVARQDLDRIFVTHNEELLAMVGAQLETELREVVADAGIAQRVRRALMRSMAGKRPTVQHVARELGMSARTLQRHLTDGGGSFQRLAEDARREMAHHYLRQSSVEFHEVAYLLGYEDANSFFRAFRQWEGTSPGAWRARHGAVAGG